MSHFKRKVQLSSILLLIIFVVPNFDETLRVKSNLLPEIVGQIVAVIIVNVNVPGTTDSLENRLQFKQTFRSFNDRVQDCKWPF